MPVEPAFETRGLSPVGKARSFSVESSAETISGQLKRGRSGRFEIICDEPEYLGGLDIAAAPLEYYALAILFCEMTQIVHFAQYKKVEISSIKAQITLHCERTGSVLAETIETGGRIEVAYQIETPEGQELEDVQSVLRAARAGCYARQMTAKATPIHDTLTLNGEPLDVD